MCDNHRFPMERIDAESELKQMLETVLDMNGKFQIDHIVQVIRGERTTNVKNYGHDHLEMFGSGDEKSHNFWKSVVRQAAMDAYLEKDIETYGTLTITEKGRYFIKH